MDRIASLIVRAHELRRQIYASIPFEVRLATFFAKLAGKFDEWGRAIGAEFLISGVTDMPDPGEKWNPKAGSNAWKTLPRDYMESHMKRLYATLLSKFKDPGIVNEAIQTFVARAVTQHPIDPEPFSKALNLMLKSTTNAALSIIRSQRKDHDSLDAPGGGDDEAATALIDELATPGPSVFEELQRAMTPRVWKMWLDYITRHTHPAMPAYISLSLEGYDADEIIGDPPSGKPGMLQQYGYEAPASGYRGSTFYRHVRKIGELSEKFFQSHRGELHVPV